MNVTHLSKYLALVGLVPMAGCNEAAETRSETALATVAEKRLPTEKLPADEQKENDMSAPVTAEKMSLSSCAQYREKGRSAEVLIDDFLTDFPKEIFDPPMVENYEMSTAQLGQVTQNLACAAALSGFGPDVPESALALFASKKHGSAAMASLKSQAKGTSAEAKAAREFVEQMMDYLAGPGE